MPTLEDECQQAVGRLKAALIALYDTVGADPDSPQDVARSFRIGSTLSWNIAKLLQAPDAFAAVPHVPGSASIEKILKAARSKGAPERALKEVRDAAEQFEKMVEIHVGDRPTLDLIIDGLATNGASGLELSRKRAFHGNSGIYGVQAKTYMMSCYVAPNPDDPEQIDMVMVRGYVALRRLRPSARIPVFRIRQWSEAGQAIGTQQWRPLEGENAPLLSSFSRGDIPEIEAVPAEGGVDYVLQPGPIGNRGAFDCFLGDMLRAGASRFRADDDDTGEFGATVTVPSEQIIFDLIAHKDVAFVLGAEAHVYAPYFTHEHVGGQWDDAARLPIRRSPVELAGSPPAVATPLIPRYSELQSFVFDRLGWSASEFRGIRLQMKYPPFGSTVIQRFELPARS
jgi:hypothetical protein